MKIFNLISDIALLAYVVINWLEMNKLQKRVKELEDKQ